MLPLSWGRKKENFYKIFNGPITPTPFLLYLYIMKRFNFLLELLKTYNLKDGEYAVFGSAPLVITGMINDVNDLDVIIRPRSWNFETEGEYRTEDIEFFNNWPGLDVDDLIDNHTFEYKGVLFVYPEKVIEYKRKMNRLKDQDLI